MHALMLSSQQQLFSKNFKLMRQFPHISSSISSDQIPPSGRLEVKEQMKGVTSYATAELSARQYGFNFNRARPGVDRLR